MKKIIIAIFISIIFVSSFGFSYNLTIGDQKIAEKLSNKIIELSYQDDGFKPRIISLIKILNHNPNTTQRTKSIFTQIINNLESGDTTIEQVEEIPSQFSEFQQNMLTAVNAERQKEDRPGLTLNEKLNTAAQKHAEYMQSTNDFAHTTKAGLHFDQRIDNVGYVYRTAGENIARGQKDIQTVMKGWMNSPGHRQNIMDEKFSEIGVGYAGTYRVQVFATSMK